MATTPKVHWITSWKPYRGACGKRVDPKNVVPWHSVGKAKWCKKCLGIPSERRKSATARRR